MFRSWMAVGSLVLLLGSAGCSDSAEESPTAAEPAATTTTTQPPALTAAALEELGGKARERIDAQAAALTAIGYFSKQKQWKKVDAALEKTVRDIRPARAEFAAIADMPDARSLYTILVKADDQMRKYVVTYDDDPPPFTPDEFSKAQRLTDAAADWLRAVKAFYREAGVEVPAPLRSPED